MWKKKLCLLRHLTFPRLRLPPRSLYYLLPPLWSLSWPLCPFCCILPNIEWKVNGLQDHIRYFPGTSSMSLCKLCCCPSWLPRTDTLPSVTATSETVNGISVPPGWKGLLNLAKKRADYSSTESFSGLFFTSYFHLVYFLYALPPNALN